MARVRRNKINPDAIEDTGENEETVESRPDSLMDLSSANPGEMLVVHRISPQWCGGYLGYLTVPDEGIDDIHDLIKREYGGGLFRIRRKSRSEGGRFVYRKGCAHVQIAGAPAVNGEVISDPTVQVRSHNPGSSSPIVIQQPTQAPASDLHTQLLGMVQQTLQRAMNGGSPNAVSDVAGIVKALAPLMQGAAVHAPAAAAAQDPWAMLDKALGMAVKLAKINPASESTAAASTESLLGLGSPALEQMLISRFLGGQAPQPQPQPMQGPPGAIPNGYVWHPQHGLLPWPPQPQAAAPISQAAPAVAPTPAPAHVQNPTPAPAPAEFEEAGEYEPLTEDEIADDLASRTPEQIEALFKGVLERVANKRPDLVQGIEKPGGVTLTPAPWMSVPTPS